MNSWYFDPVEKSLQVAILVWKSGRDISFTREAYLLSEGIDVAFYRSQYLT